MRVKDSVVDGVRLLLDISCSLMKSITKDGDPTGIPSKQNPSQPIGGEGRVVLILHEGPMPTSITSRVRH